MQLRSQITGFKQEECEPLALACDRMKEAIRNCPNHGMEEFLFLYRFYNGLNHMSKTMLDTAAGGTIMGKPIEDVKKLLDDMQENHAQWHVERTSTKKVNAIQEDSSELTTKLEELISLMKGKEEVNVNAIIDEDIIDVNFIARNFYSPNWKIIVMLLNFPILIMEEHQIILMELVVEIEILLKKLLKVLLLAKLSRMKTSRIS